MSFPPLPLGWLGWIALVPLGIGLELRARTGGGEQAPWRAGFGLGYLAGFILFLAGLHWIAFLSPIAVTVPGIMFPAWPAAAAYLALFPALVGAVCLRARVRWGLPIALTLPLVWIGAEKFRALGELGFPWLSLGYSQWATGPVLQWASLGGPALVGLWVAVVNGFGIAAVWAWMNGNRGGGGRRAGAALLCLAVVVIGGRFFLTPAGDLEPQGSRLALIQGNIAGDIKWDRTRNQNVTALFLSMSRQSLQLRPDLIVWPETATGSYLRRDPVAQFAVRAVVDSSGVPLLTGYPDYRVLPDDQGYLSTNSAGLFLPGRGLVNQYDKMHLVPFGERMPFQRWLPMLGDMDFGQAEFTPGESVVLLAAPPDTAGVLICFESIYPEISREARARGANLLVIITNDEWFGKTGALYQHASMSVFRAVENRLPLARCANTGLSFFVDTRGRVYEGGGAFTREIRVARIDRFGPRPLYSRWGDWAGWICLILALAIAVVSVWPLKK
jgi:apolipoprotein N-acyltransferase